MSPRPSAWGRVQSFTVGRQSAKTRFLATILLISDDLDEVLALADRIAVLHGGRLTAALPAAKWSRDSIGLAMTGLAPDTAMPTP